MTYFRLLTATSALALVAGPAMADLTANDVWSDWQDLFARNGLEITTEGQSASDGTLSITGITASFEIPDGDIAVSLGNIAFIERSDGTVSVAMADEMPISFAIPDNDGGGTVGFTIFLPAASMIASGDTSKVRYNYDYPELRVGDFTIDAPEMPEDFPLVMDLSLMGMTGFVELADDDVRSYSTDTDIAVFGMDFSFADPEGDEGEFSFSFSMSDLVSSATGAMGDIELDMGLSEMIGSGYRQNGTGSYGPTTYEIGFNGPDGGFEMATSAASGTLELNFGENGISYGGASQDVTIFVASNMMPIPPVTLKIAETGGQFSLPIVPGEDPQDFSLEFRLTDFAIDDMLWGMFDPAGVLPRDPATIEIDLSGKAIVTQDVTDPEFAEAMENMEMGPPGTLEELNINSVRLSFAGADLTGDGAFVFNNDMGIPMPSGTANMMLVGANGLMDKLVSMGLLPEEQAMGARMMLGLFARPGNGEDTLVSTIEVNEDGSILANGQRIK